MANASAVSGVDGGSALAAALAYLARGWVPVPMSPRRKRPLLPWRELQKRRPTEAEVKGWYRRWPSAGVAVVTGGLSGLVVLDVDPANGGGSSLAAMEARHGALPRTVEVRTGGGGRHLYFAHPGGEVRNRAGFAPGLDLRGDGGIIIAPPSIHPSGRPYAWCAGRSPGDLDLAPLPVWLDPRDPGDGAHRGHSPAYWRELVQVGVEAGRRNSTIASFAGHLLWHGVDPDIVLELLLGWNRMRCRPPLGDAEVAEVVRSIERAHRRGEGGDNGQSAG